MLLLAAIQHKATLWILGVFCASPTGGIKALVSLISIHLHLKKLVKWSCLRAATLPSQHALMSLLSAKHSKSAPPHPKSLALLNNTQCACLKGPLLNTETSLLNFTECSNLLYTEAIPGCRLLDSFPNHISFYPCNCSSLRDCKTHLQSLDHLCLEASSSSSTLVVVTDASVILSRCMQAVSAAHIWNLGQQVLSFKAPAGRTTAPDAKLFAIRLGIAKATSIAIE